MFSLIFRILTKEKQDVKVEGGLFGKRKGASRTGRGIKYDNGDKYDQSMLHICMKMSQ
jgi:hypothetical protein